ncbi:MAG: 3-deoxy-7-phosphoheptulonate synthase [Kiritimatiellaeota bacterium]|nr:3-deoxy-7-phosphoheptulonate synthase [Kiritimatiellota bacterium]
MILVLKHGTPPGRVEAICAEIKEKYGVQPWPSAGSAETLVGLVGDTSRVPISTVEMMDGVARVIRVQEPYKHANRAFHPGDTRVNAGGVEIGGPRIVVCAGPCSVESEAQILGVAADVKAAGAAMLRGGAFKPRTSPYAFQGLKAEGLLYLKNARRQTGLPVVSEITNPAQVELFNDYVDVFQIGARNMQNFELLKQVGQCRKPVLLKRGFANSLEELLMSAEHVMSGGNPNVILCERGIRTFETATRNTLDISAIPVLKAKSHLPVVADPSHAGGSAWLVEPLSKAAIAAGADGLLIEVHDDPKNALSDGKQSLSPAEFADLMQKLAPVAKAVGREM